MVKQSRPNDNELIERMAEEGEVSHQGTSGGNLARKVGTRAELHRAEGNLAGEEVERVVGSDNPAQDEEKGEKTLNKIRSGRQSS